MPTVDIFRDGKLIDRNEFRHQFIILGQEYGDLLWAADEEVRRQSGILKIWIRRQADEYYIAHLLPSWILVVNGDEWKPGFYEDVNITDRSTELKNRNYRFVFHLMHAEP